ncbi:MAG: ECF transporter S component [Chloroflexi bacterium]|nr:MAG: ECF transporter S component [Chloroflexota bacterium]MBL1196763.1 ECF transporter S component [Chloroflexota bacterium]NOH14057.1 ECF transporter S component [Chloroflexota bacterium]
MTESEVQAPKRSALFIAAGKGSLIGIALSLIWPFLRLLTGQDAPIITVFILYFVVLGVTGATAAAFYISSNGMKRRPAVFSGMLAGLFVGLIAGFLNALVSPNMIGGNSLLYAIVTLGVGILGIIMGLLGAWGTSLLPSTMFFQAETPMLESRLGEEKKEPEVVEEKASSFADTINTPKPQEAEDSPMSSEGTNPFDLTDELRSEVQSGEGFASDNVISTPWDEGKSEDQEDSFKPPWEIDTPEESFKEEVVAEEEEAITPDESYTPAWATSLRSTDETSEEPAAKESALASRLSDLAPAEDFSSVEEETPEIPAAPAIAEEPVPAAEPKTKLQEAVDLYEGGQKEAAQRMLAQIVRNDEPENALAWLWLAATLENDLTKKRFCVQRAITIDPGNQAAQELAADIEATILPPKP